VIKPYSTNHYLATSLKRLTLTYSLVETQNVSGGNTPEPASEEGRNGMRWSGWEGRGGEGKEWKGGEGHIGGEVRGRDPALFVYQTLP